MALVHPPGDLVLGIGGPGKHKQLISLTIGESLWLEDANGFPSIRSPWTLTQLTPGAWTLDPTVIVGRQYVITLVDVPDALLKEACGIENEDGWSRYIQKL